MLYVFYNLKKLKINTDTKMHSHPAIPEHAYFIFIDCHQIFKFVVGFTVVK